MPDVKKVGRITIYGMPIDPFRSVTKPPDYYVAVVNGIIVKREKDATTLIQWAVDHVDDKFFALGE